MSGGGAGGNEHDDGDRPAHPSGSLATRGVLIVGGNNIASSLGSAATLNITGGGTVSGTGANGFIFSIVGRNGASGTLNISGAGSQLARRRRGRPEHAGPRRRSADAGRAPATRASWRRQRHDERHGRRLARHFRQRIRWTAVARDDGPAHRPVSTAPATVTVSGAGSSIIVSSSQAAARATPYLIVGNGGNAADDDQATAPWSRCSAAASATSRSTTPPPASGVLEHVRAAASSTHLASPSPTSAATAWRPSMPRPSTSTA